MNLIRNCCVGAALVSVSLSTSAIAQSCSGHYGNMNVQYTSFEVGEGHKVDSYIFRQALNSTNSPLNVVGECSGFTHTMPDGRVRMSGVCAYRSKEGGYVNEWAMEPGAARGTWKATAGTGVFAGKAMSGWWENMIADGPQVLGKWGGNCR
jgi:hypothetical protein